MLLLCVCVLGFNISPEYGGSAFLWNVCEILPDHIASVSQDITLNTSNVWGIYRDDCDDTV
jgi:hypothetical protein